MRPGSHTVSVIVPVRDGERYIGAALESIACQTFPADEILVIDDGSQDASPRIAREFAPLVRCVSTAPQGPAAALNHGVSLARGDLLTFLDSDDTWSRTKLARQCERLTAEPDLEAVFGGVEFFLSHDLTPAEASRLVCPTAVQSGWLIGTMMIRRASFTRVGQLAESLQVGDFVDWAHRARGLGLRALNLPEVLLNRRLHARNLSRIGRGDRGDFLKIARAALRRHRAMNDGTADGPFPADHRRT